MAETFGIPDGAAAPDEGRTYVMDDGELVKIACSFPDMEAALESLRAGNMA